jgi:hypothetical protein
VPNDIRGKDPRLTISKHPGAFVKSGMNRGFCGSMIGAASITDFPGAGGGCSIRGFRSGVFGAGGAVRARR